MTAIRRAPLTEGAGGISLHGDGYTAFVYRKDIRLGGRWRAECTCGHVGQTRTDIDDAIADAQRHYWYDPHPRED